MSESTHSQKNNQPATEWAWVEALPVSALVISADRIVLAINAAAEDEFGYSREELVGQPADFLIPAYAWPPTGDGLTLNLAAETASGTVNPVDVFLGPANLNGQNAYLAMVESLEYESEESEEETNSAVRDLLTDIGRIVSSSLDIQSVCEQFSMAVMRSVPTERVAICATHDGNNEYHIINAVPALPSDDETDAVINFESGALLDAFETHAPVLVTSNELEEVISDDLAPLGWYEQKTEAVVIVPLMAGSTRVGALILASSKADAFSFDDIDLLGQASGQVAGTISNLQLHADLQRESDERQLLASVAREASSVVEFSQAIGPIAEELSQTIDFDSLEIASIDRSVTGGALRLSWNRDDKAHPVSERFAYSGSIEESVALDMLPLVAAGKELEVLKKHYTSEQLDSSRWGSLITVPMTMLSQVVGTLTVRSKSKLPYPYSDVEMLTRVANQLAGALQSARMYGRQQKEAEIKRSLAAISVAVSEDLELQRVFQRVSDELAVLVMYDHLTLSSVQNDEDEQWQEFSIGVDFEAPEYKTKKPQETDTWSGRSLGARPKGKLGAAMKAAGLNSLIEVPLGTQASGHIGYLTMMNREENAYNDNDLSLVAQVAAQVTPAIQNAMSHEQALELAESREKQSLLEAKSIELQRVNEAKSSFLAMVSHELRTPLTSISAYTDLLERNRTGNLSEKQVRQLGVVKRNSAHLSRLISDLLDISKIESPEFTLTKADFDLSEVVTDLVESLEPLVKAKEQRITADIVEGIELIADKQKITQVISNLIENAVKYSPADSDITVKTSLYGGDAQVVISDTGFGISKDDQEQIFEAFFRSRTEENWEVPGTGLGLALVKRIISMHGGTVTIDSEIGIGSSFTILLPVLTATAAESAEHKASLSEKKTAEDKAEATLLARRKEMAKLAGQEAIKQTPPTEADTAA
jgi:signal transduction histidine kinase/putative methionine-R-sulfoxide reductase with GAF domain